MSLSSLTEDFTVTIKRFAGTRGTSGGRGEPTWTTAARGTLPTSMPCYIKILNAKERSDFGVRGDKIGLEFMTTAQDPRITVEDRLFYADDDGVNWEVKVLTRSYRPVPKDAVWVCLGEADSAEYAPYS